MKIRVYVEGGGEGAGGRREVRKGFHKFFENALGDASKRVSVTACGSRDTTFRDFKNGLASHPDEFVILLVDSEARVMDGDTVWIHLSKRDPSWERPSSINDEQLHLMVQTMEAWLIADRQALQNFYKQHFNLNPIPKSLEPALQEASKNTTKGIYHKINHGPHILGTLDPQEVSKASKHCKRLLATMVERLA